jgi:hypothetical protein
MKANEIRLGNFVNFMSQYSDVWIDTTIETPMELNQVASFPNSFKPINLSEYWLNKMGFKKKVHKWHDGSVSTDLFWLNNYFIGLYGDYNALSRVVDREHQFIRNIDFVHQLQNVYYYLNDVELNCL